MPGFFTLNSGLKRNKTSDYRAQLAGQRDQTAAAPWDQCRTDFSTVWNRQLTFSTFGLSGSTMWPSIEPILPKSGTANSFGSIPIGWFFPLGYHLANRPNLPWVEISHESTWHLVKDSCKRRGIRQCVLLGIWLNNRLNVSCQFIFFPS